MTAQSALASAGPQAAQIEWLWWVMLSVATVVYFATMGMLFLGVFRPRSRPESILWKLIGLSTGLTVVVLFGLVVASVSVGGATARLPAEDAIKINITGYQWWWRAEYEHPEAHRRFQTANELHIPVGRTVVLTMTAADVIHSFWVPSLHGKRDLIPGVKTTLSLRADRPGTYRGQCAEFCGYQHAHMGLLVVAEPAEQFNRWYANQMKPAVVASTEEQRRGQEVSASF